jgi:uncharacterized membrane protein YgdD (TMEM256/DUF423 family)
MGRFWVALAAFLGATGIGIGALGAHGLPELLADRGLGPELVAKRVHDCETAVKYQLVHALAVLIIGLHLMASPHTLSKGWLQGALLLMTGGVVLFSGGLYSVIFADTLGHWAIIPSGGLLMILGWVCLIPSISGGRRPVLRRDGPGDSE